MGKNGFTIPKINIPLEKVLMMDSHPIAEIPKNKYIICLCYQGGRGSKACFHLKNRGCLFFFFLPTINVFFLGIKR